MAIEPSVRSRYLALVMGVASAGTSVSALPNHGGGGGAPFFLDCGDQGVLVHVGMEYGNVVTSLEGTCVKLRTDLTWSSSFYSTGKTGGASANYYGEYAGAGRAITRLWGRTGLLVDQLGFSSSKVTYEGGKLKATGAATGGFPNGGTGGSPFDDTCPDGTLGRGLRGRSGNAIDQIELVCHHPAPSTTAMTTMAVSSAVPVARAGGFLRTTSKLGSVITKDVVKLDSPTLSVQGGRITFGTPPAPGQYMIGQGSRIDTRFSVKNVGYNGSYTSSVGRVPLQVSVDGNLEYSGDITNLTQFQTILSTLGTQGMRLPAGRHEVSVALDPDNTLGEDAESRKNNSAKWTLEFEESRTMKITSLTVPSPRSNGNNSFKLVIQNDRAEHRTFPFRFAVFASNANPESLRTSPVSANVGSGNWSSSHCSYEAEVWLKHGENVIERPFHKCGNAGDTKKIVAVLDPRNEVGEATEDLADNLKWFSTTWQ